MRRFFRGEKSIHDCIDFETRLTCFEVKSCHLFNGTTNSNHHRKETHKRCKSHQLGRFVINGENHALLKRWSDEKKKMARYIFVVHVGKKFIFDVVPWECIVIDETKRINFLSIHDIFGCSNSFRGHASLSREKQ